MELDRNLRICLGAYRRGFLDEALYTQAMLDLARDGLDVNEELFWVEGGRLTKVQFDLVLNEMVSPNLDDPFLTKRARRKNSPTAEPKPAASPAAKPVEVPAVPAQKAKPKPIEASNNTLAALPLVQASPAPTPGRSSGQVETPNEQTKGKVSVHADSSSLTQVREFGKTEPHLLQRFFAKQDDGTVVVRTGNTAQSPSQPASSKRAPAPVVLEQERYVSMAVLGSGGMGEVYECIDRALNRKVALKMTRHDLVSDDLTKTLLEREARVVGSLEHPNIIPVYDAGIAHTGQPFYTMRLLRHPTLETIIRQLREQDADTLLTFTLGRLLRDFIQVCHAVDYAHSRGFVHCDIKPANILVGDFGEVMVVDWGLAHRMNEQPEYRGGTPAYMAPEQLTSTGTFDARTDVFALGAILYELLCLEPAFTGTTSITALGETEIANTRVALPPSQRSPQRTIPEELEEACLKALQIDPVLRFPSARLLAEAIETFLEGTKEKERRMAHALESVDQGQSLAESYLELIESRPERLDEVREMRATIAPWEGADRKQALWDAEERLAVLDALCIRTLQAATAAFELALDDVPGMPEARAGLARLYRHEVRRAVARRDEADRLYFEGLLRQFDDEEPESSMATMVLDATSAAKVTIDTLEEHSRRLVPVRSEILGSTPIDRPMTPGSYLLTFEDGANSKVHLPVLLAPGQRFAARIDIASAALLASGEILIPGGPALLGGDESSLLGRELIEVFVPGFAIMELPVSFGEYLEFLSTAYLDDPPSNDRFIPRTGGRSPGWEWHNGKLVATGALRWGPLEHVLQLPCFGVDLESCQAFARWKSKKTGHRYRLPNEWEWEKAARGTDGRRYPWGDKFDASFCKMRESRAGAPRPEPRGTFSPDRSPFGVRDVAGGLAEWALPPPDVSLDNTWFVASRGGAWCDWEVDCALGARRGYSADERSSRVGFRLVREFDPVE